MLSRIVVPLDGSLFAEAALPLAAAVARATGASLELISACMPVPPASVSGPEGAALGVPVHADALAAVPITSSELSESLREQRITYLHDAARRLREHASVDPSVALLDGRADRAVAEHVESGGADLVVMATHGRGALERAWLGSVADSLVRQLPVPILLVRPVEDERPNLSVDPVVRRVVVALDGSALAEAALEPAAELARALAVPVVLVRAVGAHVEIQSSYIPHAAQAYQEQLEAERAEARSYLDEAAGRVAGPGVEVAERVVREGAAPRVILSTADAEGVDVVAMATHGRGGLRRLLLGSVSDKVVRAATGPVLLVRPREKD
jgi:nucleotide-binding universal stress UspA family protein